MELERTSGRRAGGGEPTVLTRGLVQVGVVGRLLVEREVYLWVQAGRGDGRWVCWQAEVRKDPVQDLRRGDHDQDGHGGPALAAERINPERSIAC